MRHDFELLISEEQIRYQLKEISQQLNREYHGQEVTLVMVMKGALCLVADLMRLLEFPTTLEFISASSYGIQGTQRGDLTVSGLKDMHVQGKHVLVIDDVFHSGHTLFHIVSELKNQHPKSVKSLVLLLKEISRDISYVPEYYLFQIGNPFVIGYGMDYKELYRGLPGIYIYQS